MAPPKKPATSAGVAALLWTASIASAVIAASSSSTPLSTWHSRQSILWPSQRPSGECYRKRSRRRAHDENFASSSSSYSLSPPRVEIPCLHRLRNDDGANLRRQPSRRSAFIAPLVSGSRSGAAPRPALVVDAGENNARVAARSVSPPTRSTAIAGPRPSYGVAASRIGVLRSSASPSYSSSSRSQSPQPRRKQQQSGRGGGRGGGSGGRGGGGGRGGDDEKGDGQWNRPKLRGANAANRNRAGHAMRASGVKRPPRKNAPRSPRWEKEGDRLYADFASAAPSFADVDGDIENYDDDDGSSGAAGPGAIATVKDALRALDRWTLKEMPAPRENEGKTPVANDRNESDDGAGMTTGKGGNVGKEKGALGKTSPEANPKSSFLWGSLPVGPILSARLAASGRHEPTPVQRAAFSVLSAGAAKGKGKVGGGAGSRKQVGKRGLKNSGGNGGPTHSQRSNAVIASPTGTGKTLAYLLPLLCTSPGGRNGEGAGGVLVVTPTIELAVQIQREVDILWPPEPAGTDTVEPSSALLVVGAGDDCDDGGTGADRDELAPERLTLRRIGRTRPTLVAGTPKMLRALYREAERVLPSTSLRVVGAKFDDGIDPATLYFPPATEEERSAAVALRSNLRAVVLDEADRLLRTEAAAREGVERKQRKLLLDSPEEEQAHDAGNTDLRRRDGTKMRKPKKRKQAKLMLARPTQTELLLRDLPVGDGNLLDSVQIVCASATIGRTLRRQLMGILDAPSTDAAAVLVAGEGDVREKSKVAEERQGAILPGGGLLRHAYRIVPEPSPSDWEDASSTASLAERRGEARVMAALNAVWDTLISLPGGPRPTIIFPGRVGVERVRVELEERRGLRDVRTLRNLDGLERRVGDGANDGDPSVGWRDVPVYIIGERFARGLDLPDVKYVLLLSPPSSAAGYAHMSGRTGRNGSTGTAITLVRPRIGEVHRMLAVAEALGVRFLPSPISGVAAANGDVGGGGSIRDLMESSDRAADTNALPPSTVSDSVDELSSLPSLPGSPSEIRHPWAQLSESALKRKTNAELSEYLKQFGVAIADIGRYKADLVAAVRSLHAGDC